MMCCRHMAAAVALRMWSSRPPPGQAETPGAGRSGLRAGGLASVAVRGPRYSLRLELLRFGLSSTCLRLFRFLPVGSITFSSCSFAKNLLDLP